MKKLIRIGTRESQLALWQANTVKDALEAKGHNCELVPITSQGDVELETPLYELGVVGIFTKTLDVALLSKQIDIAVHSMKDVPTALPKGIAQAAVLERGDTQDVLIHKGNAFLKTSGAIATGSLRRKAQWLNKYPQHEVVGLRGNVNTRLKKLQDNPWNGAIFAKAGLERIGLLPEQHEVLNWMIPAPAQGAVMLAARSEDTELLESCKAINHIATSLATNVEREFLRTLEGGCTAPIGGYAFIKNQELHFKGGLFSLDGQQKLLIERKTKLPEVDGFGAALAQELLKNGGAELMQQIKAEL